MQNLSGLSVGDKMDLPPGFRFHPSDEELIIHYLQKKVVDSGFSARAIGEVDLNKSEPWELPWKAKMGEIEWYFFCVRDRKYPTGSRTNRATDAGYWKATGKDREIYRGKSLVGMKKTLVFYKGRAPKGEKTNWVMHEFRLDPKFSVQYLPKTPKNEWVICRIFQKSSGGKKIPISGLMKIGQPNIQTGPSKSNSNSNNIPIPLLKDSSPYINKPKPEPVYVPCFSNHAPGNQISYFHNSLISTNIYTQNPISNSTPFYSTQNPPILGNPQRPRSDLGPDQSILMSFDENRGPHMDHSGCFKTESERVRLSQDKGISSVLTDLKMGKRPFDNLQGPSSSSSVQVDLDCLWNY